MSERPTSARPTAGLGRPTTARGSLGARPPSAVGARTIANGPLARPSSAMRVVAQGGDPASSARAVLGRPGTGALKTGYRQGTASRQDRPGSRVGVPINVAHRPVTQQGLQGVRPMSSRGLANRQVQDKTYFLGLLRAKMTDLNTEINRLRKETDYYEKERKNYLIYEKQAEELAREIAELQGQLSDFNMLVDKMNTHMDTSDMQDDVDHLKAQNDVESASVDQLFSERRAKEDAVKELEHRLEQEKVQAASIMSNMDVAIKEKYFQAKSDNEQLLETLRLKQQELYELTKKKDDMEDELAVNPLKQEAMIMYQRLVEAETKRDALVSDIQAEGTPEEQRERLLEKVKKDNEEIASMERQAAEVRENIEQIHEELRELDEEMENEQSEKNQKYKELRQKEQHMDEFLDGYDQNRMADLARIEKLQKNNVRLLSAISKVIVKQQMANVIEPSATLSNGEIKADPLAEYQIARSELSRLEEVDRKSSDELQTLRQKMEKMQQELEIYGNLDSLKMDAESKKSTYVAEKAQLSSIISDRREAAEQLQESVKNTKLQLADSEYYAQIRNLEQRLQHIHQNNFVLREAVESRQAETNVQPVAEAVASLMDDFNQLLVQSYSRKGARV